MTDDGSDDKDGTTVSSSKTVTSESASGTTVTTTTTHISKVSSATFLSVYFIVLFHLPVSHTFSYLYQVVKGGSSETRVEKRIVISADSDVDKDKVQTPCAGNMASTDDNVHC